jgi:hypothetical protein
MRAGAVGVTGVSVEARSRDVLKKTANGALRDEVESRSLLSKWRRVCARKKRSFLAPPDFHETHKYLEQQQYVQSSYVELHPNATANVGRTDTN